MNNVIAGLGMPNAQVNVRPAPSRIKKPANCKEFRALLERASQAGGLLNRYEQPLIDYLVPNRLARDRSNGMSLLKELRWWLLTNGYPYILAQSKRDPYILEQDPQDLVAIFKLNMPRVHTHLIQQMQRLSNSTLRILDDHGDNWRERVQHLQDLALEPIANLPIEQVETLLEGCGRVNMPFVFDQCVKVLCRRVSKETLAESIDLALKYNLENLLSVCVTHLNQHVPSIQLTKTAGRGYSLDVRNSAAVDPTYREAIQRLEGRTFSATVREWIREPQRDVFEADLRPGCMTRLAHRIRRTAFRNHLVTGYCTALKWVCAGAYSSRFSNVTPRFIHWTGIPAIVRASFPAAVISTFDAVDSTINKGTHQLYEWSGIEAYRSHLMIAFIAWTVLTALPEILSVAEAAPTLVRLAAHRVRKGFRTARTRVSSLVSTASRIRHCMDFSTLAVGAFDNLTEQDIRWGSTNPALSVTNPALATLSPQLRELDLSANKDITNKDLEWLVQHCPKLEKLVIGPFPKVTAEGWRHLSRLENTLQTLRVELGEGSVESLGSLDLCRLNLQRLKKIEVSMPLVDNSFNAQGLRKSMVDFFSNCPADVSLELEQLGPWFSELVNDDIEIGFLRNSLFRHTPTLAKLKTTGNRLFTDEDLQSLGENCHSLVSLWVSNPDISVDGIYELATGCRHLRVVHFKEAHMTDDCMELLANRNLLTEVTLENCPNLTDASLLALAKVRSLDYCTLINNPRMTDIGIAALQARARPLRELRISSMPAVSLGIARRTLTPNDAEQARDAAKVLDYFKTALMPISVSTSDRERLKQLISMILHGLAENNLFSLPAYKIPIDLDLDWYPSIDNMATFVRRELGLHAWERTTLQLPTVRKAAQLIGKMPEALQTQVLKLMTWRFRSVEIELSFALSELGLKKSERQRLNTTAAVWRLARQQVRNFLKSGELPTFYATYLQDGEFPRLRAKHVHYLVKKLHDDLKVWVKNNQDFIRLYLDVAPTKPPGMPMAWTSGALTILGNFVKKVETLGRAGEWEEREKIACLLGAVCSDWSWLAPYIMGPQPEIAAAPPPRQERLEVKESKRRSEDDS